MRALNTALDQQDYAAALAHAVDAWRAAPSVALADAIEVIARKAPADALAAQLAAAIAPRVVPTLARWKPIASAADPRVARFAIAQLANPPFTTPGAEPLMLAFVAATARDARLVEHAPAIRAAIDARFTRAPVRDAILRALDKALAALAKQPKQRPRASDTALLARIATLDAPARTDAELLAAIYASPDDDGPRAVYADFLQERGDPRGEFIAIQLAHAGRARDAELTPREQELLKKHGKAWLGGLAPALSWGKGYAQTQFRRGFVATADIILSVGKKLALVAADPGWATVEEIRGFYEDVLLLRAPLRALVSLDNNPSPETMARLVAANVTLPALATLDLEDHDPIASEHIRRVCPALAHLRVFRPAITPATLRDLATLDFPHVTLQRYWPTDPDALRAQLADHEAVIAALAASPPIGRIERIELSVPTRTQPIGTLDYTLSPGSTRYTRVVGS